MFMRIRITPFPEWAHIPSSGLRVITTSDLPAIPADPPPVAIENGIIYLDQFTGQRGAYAPLNVQFAPQNNCESFGDPATFANPLCRQLITSSNSLDNTVDLLQACLPTGQGRDGKMEIGLSYNLSIPPFTPHGTFSNTLTYTLSDYTDNCPAQ